MQVAIQQAREGLKRDEVPVGAVITLEGKIIAKAYNQVELLKDPTAHAEMIAITQAASSLSQKWLYDCSLYVTLEPCSMCAGALVLSRIKNIYYGTHDLKSGACGSALNIVDHDKLNHKIEVYPGVCHAECSGLITDFFHEKRMQGKK